MINDMHDVEWQCQAEKRSEREQKKMWKLENILMSSLNTLHKLLIRIYWIWFTLMWHAKWGGVDFWDAKLCQSHSYGTLKRANYMQANDIFSFSTLLFLGIRVQILGGTHILPNGNAFLTHTHQNTWSTFTIFLPNSCFRVQVFAFLPHPRLCSSFYVLSPPLPHYWLFLSATNSTKSAAFKW